jgi:hypothetical protein
MTIEHETGLPHPLIKIRGTRSSASTLKYVMAAA